MSEQLPLKVDSLTKGFGGNPVIREVSFSVKSGEIVGLLGPNGSGKSTTLHCITGLHEPSSGSIEISGNPRDSKSAKNELGFFPDDLPYPVSLTARETISFYRNLRPYFDDILVKGLVQVLGLEKHLDKQIGDYSHGMRRKLQLVLALAHHPSCLILDEPLRGLDPEAAILMEATINQFRENGGGVLIATHDLLSAQNFCDYVVILSNGTVVAKGTPQSIISETKSKSLSEALIALTGLDNKIKIARKEISDLLGYR